MEKSSFQGSVLLILEWRHSWHRWMIICSLSWYIHSSLPTFTLSTFAKGGAKVSAFKLTFTLKSMEKERSKYYFGSTEQKPSFLSCDIVTASTSRSVCPGAYPRGGGGGAYKGLGTLPLKCCYTVYHSSRAKIPFINCRHSVMYVGIRKIIILSLHLFFIPHTHTPSPWSSHSPGERFLATPLSVPYYCTSIS